MRKRLQGAPAIVIAVVALIMAMTGSAVAAGLITGRDIQNGSITRADIHNATLGINKLTNNARQQLQGQRGQRGATGARGPRGATGHTGPAGPSFLHHVRRLSDTTPWGKYEGGPDGGPTARVGVHDGHALLYNFTDGLNQDADLQYHGLDGKTLNDIAGLKYSEMSQADDPAPAPDNHPGAYLFIYTTDTAGAKHTVLFVPPSTNAGQWYQWDVLAGQVGYGPNHYPGTATTKSDWDTLMADHGTDVIDAFYIGVGTETTATNSNTYVDDVQFEVDGQPAWYDFG